MTGGKRDRYITKGIKEKVDNILQHIIWKEFVTPARLKNDEYLEIRLIACPFGSKQMVMLEDNLGKNICDQDCYLVPQRCNEEVIVFYDKENNSETMMLRNESQTAINWDQIKEIPKDVVESGEGSEDTVVENAVVKEPE